MISDVISDKFTSIGNQSLFMQMGDALIQDNFEHEQNLIINADDKKILIAGCAHKGIVNILEHLKNAYNIIPSHVIGGFI